MGITLAGDRIIVTTACECVAFRADVLRYGSSKSCGLQKNYFHTTRRNFRYRSAVPFSGCESVEGPLPSAFLKK